MFYIEENNKIVLFDESYSKLVDTIKFMPQYHELEILETDKNIVAFDGEFYFADDEEYIEKKKQAEKERIASLYMTRSDFFDGFILAFNLGQVELRAIVENILNSINITDVEIKVALNNFDNALNFYRKHTLFTLLNNVEIPINEDLTLLFTPDIWDKFFDTKDYKELQKAIQIKPEPEPSEV